MKNTHTITFDIRGDDRGSLIALEGNKNIPFDIKRVYYIFGTGKNIERGFHSHKNLQQVLIATSGSCDIVLDNGSKTETIHLDSPKQGLFIGNNIWRVMKNFSSDCVLFVLASDYYNEADYIRNYDEFLKRNYARI